MGLGGGFRDWDNGPPKLYSVYIIHINSDYVTCVLYRYEYEFIHILCIYVHIYIYEIQASGWKIKINVNYICESMTGI